MNGHAAALPVSEVELELKSGERFRALRCCPPALAQDAFDGCDRK
jgi:hypothetical protein